MLYMLGLDVVVVRGQGGPRREHRLPLRHDRQGLHADEPTLREGTGCPKNQSCGAGAGAGAGLFGWSRSRSRKKYEVSAPAPAPGEL